MVGSVNSFLSVLTVIAQVVVVIGLAGYLSPQMRRSSLWRWVGRNGLVLAFIVALTATLGSLFFSLVAGYPPCELCWYQRIGMYPLVFILGLGLLRKDREGAADYSLAVLIPGALIALYHNYLYFRSSGGGACAPGEAGMCLVRFVFEFNYVTIPLMSLTAYLLIAGLLLLKRGQRN